MFDLIFAMFIIWIWIMALAFWFLPKTLGGWLADVTIAYRAVMERAATGRVEG